MKAARFFQVLGDVSGSQHTQREVTRMVVSWGKTKRIISGSSTPSKFLLDNLFQVGTPLPQETVER